jgi:hypothetical protein
MIVNDGAAQDLGSAATFSAEATLKPGDNTIRVEAVDAVGNTGVATVTVKLDIQAPTTAPTKLAGIVNPTGNAIRLTYEADKNASTYNVYRSNTEITQIGKLSPIATGIADTELTDSNIIPGLTFYYAVTSVSSAGKEGTVVSNSPNVTLVTNLGGVAALSDGTSVNFGPGVLFKNSALSASATIEVLSDSSLADLPLALANSGRSIKVTGQSGASVETFNRSATLTLVYPESIKDSDDSPRIFEQVGEKWVEVANQIIDVEGNAISALIKRPGIYRLGEIQLNPWDVNVDNIVNIFDLVIVGGQFGMTPPENLAADINGDGTVNIFDLVLVGSHFGESYGGAAAAPIALSSGPSVEVRMVAVPAQGEGLVTVQIHTDSATNLGGFQFDLGFDVNRLSLVGATEGGVFESQGRQSYWLPPQISINSIQRNAVGKVVLGSAAINAPVVRGLNPRTNTVSDELATVPSLHSGQVLAEITFRVNGDVNEGLKSVRLENVQVAALDGMPIQVRLRHQVDVTSLTKRNFQNALLQNYPNPFNPETWIPYSVAKDTHVTLNIYNVLGQPVRTIDLGFVSAGEYMSKEKAAYWDGRNQDGEHVASGVYFYTIQAGQFVASKKLVVLK